MSQSQWEVQREKEDGTPETKWEKQTADTYISFASITW